MDRFTQDGFGWVDRTGRVGVYFYDQYCDGWSRPLETQHFKTPYSPRKYTHYWLILCFLFLPSLIFGGIGFVIPWEIPKGPDGTTRLYIVSTAAQVGATSIAILFAALTLVLTRPDIRGTERAIAHVIRAPQSKFTAITLLSGTLLALVGIGLIPSSEPTKWSAGSFLNLCAISLVASGLLGAVWWLFTARNILSPDVILASFIEEIPTQWIDKANEKAQVAWQSAFEESKMTGRLPPLFHEDSRAFSLSLDDPMVVAVDALSGWLLSSRGRPIAEKFSGLLDRLYISFLGANMFLAEYFLPTHLAQLLHAALELDDPRVIQVTVQWISNLHMAWEEAGGPTVRSNSQNWLVPPIAKWIQKRNFDLPSRQIFLEIMRSAARKSKKYKSDAMSIALGHFLQLLATCIKQNEPWAATYIWMEIDIYLRTNGPRSPSHCLEEIRNIIIYNEANKMPVLGGPAGEAGTLRDWMVIGLGHAISEALNRADRVETPLKIKEAEEAWACRVAENIQQLYNPAEEPQWYGARVEGLIDQVNRGLARCGKPENFCKNHNESPA